ncbi:hypothetical protein [Methyloterricola oryzae]|uniref:hypothetical protein n=1 Tax=Methyloterricola oryzae TaxID=1495050 RepID=UPI0005EB998D|nr:hypothetical protein [Methyloterricola oryzae]
MTFKARLIRIAINLTPEWLIKRVSNFILKEIAELKFFHFDLEARKLYVEVQLLGESETIQVWVEDFSLINENGSCTLVIDQARSNRLWLTNLLSKIAGRAWRFPAPAQFGPYVSLVSELLPPKAPAS